MLPLLALLPPALGQIIATGPNGPTNPDEPAFAAVGTTVNQKSDSRLISVNSVDDFCLFAPMEPNSIIGNVEHNVVAWCTKPRNNARIIPDGTIKSVQFLRTPSYVQVSGWWDGTKVNIQDKDEGGELDPHGATQEGNPVGGNVTTNVPTGSDVFYEEWMSFVSYDQFCVRICTAVVGGVSVARQCDHKYDLQGCQFVMAIDDYWDMQGFESCDSDIAAPPGLYPNYTWTQGMEPTPSDPAFLPKRSNCVQHPSIANGLNPANPVVTAPPGTGGNGTLPTASVNATITGNASVVLPTASINASITGNASVVLPTASVNASITSGASVVLPTASVNGTATPTLPIASTPIASLSMGSGTPITSAAVSAPPTGDLNITSLAPPTPSSASASSARPTGDLNITSLAPPISSGPASSVPPTGDLNVTSLAPPRPSSSSSLPTNPSTGSTELNPSASPDQCLGVSGELANGALVSVGPCTGAPTQQWEFVRRAAIPFKLAGTNWCLDAGLGSRIGTKLKIWACNGQTQQTWWYTTDNHLAIAGGPGICMQAVGGGAEVAGCHQSKEGQVWMSSVPGGGPNRAFF